MAKSSKSSRQSAGNGEQSSSQKSAGGTQAAQKDCEALLKEDHRKVEGLFRQSESAGSSAKRQLVEKICSELVLHSRLEESVFYPACRDKKVESKLLDEAQVEHDTLKVLIGELMSQGPESDFYDAKIKVLSEYVKHHVAEEEKPKEGIFAKAREAGVDMAAVGKRLEERKQELTEDAEAEGFSQPPLRALRLQSGTFNANRKEFDMARQFDRDRDDRDRWPEDEGRGRFSGRYTREQDDQTGGRQFGPGGYADRYGNDDRGWRGERRDQGSRYGERGREDHGRFSGRQGRMAGGQNWEHSDDFTAAGRVQVAAMAAPDIAATAVTVATKAVAATAVMVSGRYGAGFGSGSAGSGDLERERDEQGRFSNERRPRRSHEHLARRPGRLRRREQRPRSSQFLPHAGTRRTGPLRERRRRSQRSQAVPAVRVAGPAAAAAMMNADGMAIPAAIPRRRARAGRIATSEINAAGGIPAGHCQGLSSMSRSWDMSDGIVFRF